MDAIDFVKMFVERAEAQKKAGDKFATFSMHSDLELAKKIIKKEAEWAKKIIRGKIVWEE